MISQGFRIWTVWEWEHWRYNGGQIGQVNGWKDGNVCTIEGLNYLSFNDPYTDKTWPLKYQFCV